MLNTAMFVSLLAEHDKNMQRDCQGLSCFDTPTSCHTVTEAADQTFYYNNNDNNDNNNNNNNDTTNNNRI